jgi:hypothetical protein
VIPYLKDAKREERLVVNRRVHELDCLLKNVQLNERSRNMDSTVEQGFHCFEETD